LNIVILDYGMGNLASVSKAVAFLGYSANVKEAVSADADKVIVPGVGAFRAAMQNLGPQRVALDEHVQAGKPLLGICLGQQLLFEWSEEMGRTEGLGYVKGGVKYFGEDLGLKVPHMGWSPLSLPKPTALTTGIENGDQTYFVHSLYTDAQDESVVAATATYGLTFAAAVEQGNVWGTQFHPEKSGDVGLKILKNFLDL
jgi:glutamine amidotransferase